MKEEEETDLCEVTWISGPLLQCKTSAFRRHSFDSLTLTHTALNRGRLARLWLLIVFLIHTKSPAKHRSGPRMERERESKALWWSNISAADLLLLQQKN